MPMAQAAAARWAPPPPGSPSRSSFLAPSPSAATTMVTRLGGRRAHSANRTVAARSGRRDDGAWGPEADPDPSTGTGRMVDEDMATLRRRIREARAAMCEDDDIGSDADAGVVVPPLPARWTELERRRRHRSDAGGVPGAASLLEAFLVNARPGLGAGVLALLLLLLGVPASAFLVGAKLVQAVDAIASVVNGR